MAPRDGSGRCVGAGCAALTGRCDGAYMPAARGRRARFAPSKEARQSNRLPTSAFEPSMHVRRGSGPLLRQRGTGHAAPVMEREA